MAYSVQYGRRLLSVVLLAMVRFLWQRGPLAKLGIRDIPTTVI